jgi:transcriptional regulator with XRE-family HTH domain
MSVAFGNYLRGICDQRGWSAARLATELDQSRSNISRWMHGETPPELDTLILISEKLGVSLAQLIEIETGKSLGSTSVLDEQTWRIAVQAQAIPNVSTVVEKFLDLSPDNQGAVLTFIDMLHNGQK